MTGCTRFARLAWAALAVTLGAGAAETMRTEVRVSADEITRAQYPELTEIEWLRFEGLMRGPRGYWTPNLDPVTTLGVHARTDAERTRYAELAARLEHDRIAGELAFAVAYADAWRRLYPDERFGADTAPLASPLPGRSPPGDSIVPAGT